MRGVNNVCFFSFSFIILYICIINIYLSFLSFSFLLSFLFSREALGKPKGTEIKKIKISGSSTIFPS